jgi:CRISPR-associated protein Csb2
MPRLLISVRFHEGRYHGRLDWPPSPARLFQALVAGVVQDDMLPEEDRRALLWFEKLEPPVIAAPPMRAGQAFRNYVPNNDLDAVGGDPMRVSEIRAPKFIRPFLFDAETSLLYAWMFDDTLEAQTNAQRICAIAERLYQLGRGIDMAWAWGEVLPPKEAEARTLAGSRILHRPSNGAGGAPLPVPLTGSFDSLVLRHKKMRVRFQTPSDSKPSKKEPNRVFAQPPQPRFRQVAYDSPPKRLLFDLLGERAPWRLDRIVELTERVRDRAAQRLKEKMPEKADTIYRTFVGRRNASQADKVARLRITPLPSIGHQLADQAIRRVLVEIPANCPIRADDVEWAFSGLLVVSNEGEILCELATAAELGMLAHYSVEGEAPALVWRTVTPAALPQQAARRRIDPARRRRETKGGAERADEDSKAVSAVIQALRHAGMSARPLSVRVQREPFERKGARAEAFAPGTRFAKEQLWHVEISFAAGVGGPLILGDGRYLGLGLMEPVKDASRDVMVFLLPPDRRVATADRADLLRAVRRALMALSRDDKGNVPPLFSGHEADGSPATSGRHRHVFLAAADLDHDGRIEQLVMAAPWICDRSARPGRGEHAAFDRIAETLEVVRAGRLGVLALGPRQTPNEGDALIGSSLLWESETPYSPTRHAGRGKDLAAAIEGDLIAECARRGLPRPEIEMLDVIAGPNAGHLWAHARMRFSAAVKGPILLGRDSHAGGGLFAAILR